ncbi:glycerophosphodiester phosphodiesterase [Ferviditalea candida]|uniref:Glycerophosphodiester phosphodiesterase n=1 Tax=Ferviditalea candida TaxID=3108399 RepID=A0ABU5ZHA6_9BACL|nr:glycerophosphodiester phosphodiesterase [Paenibacillaceae bacterium T2]
MQPLIIAHRGASGEAPENTLSAFRVAIVQHADGIELDVQMTKDGRIVVIHDETLDRTTDSSGLVAGMTYEQIRRADAGHGFKAYAGERVPLLSEVLELLAPTRMLLNIELKNGIIPYPEMEEGVIRLVRQYAMERRVILSSFNHYSLVKLAELAPDLERAVLYAAGLFEPWDYALRLGANAIHPLHYSAVPEIVQGAHRAGLKIRPYTVDREEDIRRMIANEVDAVITNYPLRMKRILEDGDGKTGGQRK